MYRKQSHVEPIIGNNHLMKMNEWMNEWMNEAWEWMPCNRLTTSSLDLSAKSLRFDSDLFSQTQRLNMAVSCSCKVDLLLKGNTHLCCLDQFKPGSDRQIWHGFFSIAADQFRNEWKLCKNLRKFFFWWCDLKVSSLEWAKVEIP